MIDFWEAIGRVIHSPELANKFIDLMHPPRDRKTMKDAQGREGLDIPTKEYETIQQLFSPVLDQGTLSIMSAGELYWTFSFKGAADNTAPIYNVIKNGNLLIDDPSPGYFIALGIIVIDHYVRDAVKAGQRPVLDGPKMSPAEKANILALCVLPGFDGVCIAFCKEPWDGHNCSDTAMVWQDHLHSLAASKPPAPKPPAQDRVLKQWA